jgi:hypothetical protein
MQDEHFIKIKQKYDSFHRFLLKNGMLPHKDTPLGFWGVTPVQELYEFFKAAELHRHQKFIDLGSGDGRAVLVASLFGVEAHGLEADPWLVNVSLHIRRELGLPHFATTKFLEDNFMEYNLRGYDAVYISPDKPFHRDGFEAKLLNELNVNGRLFVHGWEFQPSFLKKQGEHIINGEKFSVYTLK